MPSREWRLRIEDILERIDKIESYTAGMTFDDFNDDPKTIEAVQYNLVVIGEAAGCLPEEVKQKHTTIPWSKMRGMRNVVTHEYFGVNPWILWQTVQTDLGPLIVPLRDILNEDE